MKRSLMIAALAALLIVPAAWAQQGIVVEREEMISVLSGYHGAPGAEYWQKLDPASTRATLRAIIEDGSVFPVARSRAMRALTYVDGQAGEYLGARAANEKNTYLRASAYDAHARAAGEGALPALTGALNDSDAMVRIMAARNLSRIGTPEAKQTLRRAMESEKNGVARSIMSRSLKEDK